MVMIMIVPGLLAGNSTDSQGCISQSQEVCLPLIVTYACLSCLLITLMNYMSCQNGKFFQSHVTLL